MKFGEVAVEDAAGAVLAHSLRAGPAVFKKGRRLTAEDVASLAAAGHRRITVARLAPDDVPEDAAAAAVARAVAGDNLVGSAAFTGRVNLYATTRGLAVIDTDRLDRMNMIDEAITVATVPPFATVEPRQMVATVKIIPFAAPAAAVDACRDLAGGTALLRIAPFRARMAGLVQTKLPGLKASVIEKTEAATRARLAALGSTLRTSSICAHEEPAVAAAIEAQLAAGCDIVLVLGASAIVDRRDVIPAAIERAGGELVHFGMPVDPGNLLLLGRVRGRPVIGLPGCARSPKLNGFDWVLQRLLADLPVTRADIMRMGAGGLLTEIPSRPLPRHDAGPQPAAAAPRAPKIAAVVLAAGRSSRMAPANKLLAPVDGVPMVARAVDAALASQARPIVVVVGHDAQRVRDALGDRPVVFVENPDFASGLSASVRAALQVMPIDADGAVFMLGDMPRVSQAHVDRLIAAFNPADGRAICVPTHRAKRGNPVLWAARFFPEMASLSGDVGARALLAAHADQICEVEMDDDGILLDVDTPAALAGLQASGEKASA